MPYMQCMAVHHVVCLWLAWALFYNHTSQQQTAAVHVLCMLRISSAGGMSTKKGGLKVV